MGPRQKGQQGSLERATILQAHTKQMPWPQPPTITSQVLSKQMAHSTGLQAHAQQAEQAGTLWLLQGSYVQGNPACRHEL